MKKTFTNQEIAELLRSVAAVYELQGKDRFRVSAYQKAADSVDQAGADLKDLWSEGRLTEIPGIGESLADYLDELFRTGRVRHFDQLTRKMPPAMFSLMKIRGIGVKTAFKLSRELNLVSKKTSLKDLLKAAKAGKIAQIEGFGDKSERDIIAAVKDYQERRSQPERIPLPTADRIAREITDYLENQKEVIRADALGSLRRQTASVGDIDIAVATNEPEKVLNRFVKYPKIAKLVERGSAGATIELKDKTQVDLRVHAPGAYGSLLQHFTGSKSHNIKLREIALKKGWSLSEYGAKPVSLATGKHQAPSTKHQTNQKSETTNTKKGFNKGKGVYQFSSEKEFYEFLGMAWIPPELRENTGEIEIALRQASFGKTRGEEGKPDGLPTLVKLQDIKGDLHVHSNFPIEPSHDLGESSLEDMAKAAEKLGYEYLGLSEHNPSVSRHTSRQVVEIVKKKQSAIEQFNSSKKGKVVLLNGLEVDIQPDGDLALPEKAFDYLDFAIASIHSSFQIPKKAMTARVLRALEHPKIKILGHPTGRKLNYREGIELEWDEIFAFCLKHGKFLEINAWPDRLDLPDYLVREAVKAGVKMVIDSDSHRAKDLSIMRYGVSVARRGWAEKKDIVNTVGYDKITEEFQLA